MKKIIGKLCQNQLAITEYLRYSKIEYHFPSKTFNFTFHFFRKKKKKYEKPVMVDPSPFFVIFIDIRRNTMIPLYCYISATISMDLPRRNEKEKKKNRKGKKKIRIGIHLVSRMHRMRSSHERTGPRLNNSNHNKEISYA